MALDRHASALELAGGQAVYAGRTLPLGPADFGLLQLLARDAGRFVAERALLAFADCAWVADAAAAHARIGALNQLLDEHCDAGHYVMHLPGSGYSLVLPDRTHGPGASPLDERAMAPLPRLRSRLVGRQQALVRLVGNAARSRLVTVFGPGGVGKTALALAAGQRLATAFRDGAAFADLSTLTDDSALAPTVAAALGVPASGAMTADGIASFLAQREVLLVLDNCEHVVQAVAALCEAIHRSATRTHILATSREVLRCEEETVHPVHSLPSPVDGAAGTAQAALGFAAVQLLVDRLSERRPGFVLCDADAPLAAALCRRVDGLPLAIELVAGWASQLDLQRMLALLDAPLRIEQEGGPIQAAARHESLAHLLAWSYELLGPLERRVFERLALFRGHFSTDSARAAASGNGVGADDVSHALAALASKSLLVAEPGPDGARFRLLETTRDFALARLRSGGEHDEAARRHALQVRELLEDAERDWPRLSHAYWRLRHGALVDDLRAALAWCFSPRGDAALGVRLVVAGIPVVFHLDLWREFAAWYGAAVAAADAGCPVEAALEVRLRTAYGSVLMFAEGFKRGVRESYGAALAMARNAAAPLEAGALDGVWMGAFAEGDYPAALALAARCAELARAGGDPVAITRTVRMHAQSLHAMARHAEAASLAQSLLRETADIPRAAHECSIDPKISARVVLARVQWLQGRADDARSSIHDALALCVSGQTNAPLMHVLAWGAVPVSLWCGDLDAAEDFLAQLDAQCEVFRQPFWTAWVAPYRAAIDSVRGRAAATQAHDPGTKQLDMLATVMRHAVPDAVLARAEGAMAPWCAPEVFRARAEQTLRRDPSALDAAEQLVRRGFALAREQGALAWELRAATSLARLWRHRGMTIEAVDMLSAVYARFAQGHETADLHAARQLLDQLSGRRASPQPTARPA